MSRGRAEVFSTIKAPEVLRVQVWWTWEKCWANRSQSLRLKQDKQQLHSLMLGATRIPGQCRGGMVSRQMCSCTKTTRKAPLSASPSPLLLSMKYVFFCRLICWPIAVPARACCNLKVPTIWASHKAAAVLLLSLLAESCNWICGQHDVWQNNW